MAAPRRWQDMRGPDTPLEEVIESFLLHRNDLSEVTAGNYRRAIRMFTAWCERELGRLPVVADVEPGTVEAFLRFRKTTGSAESARVAWVALRSLANALAELHIHQEDGDSVLRRVRQPKVKDEQRRNLTDTEMYRLIERASEGETACRDRAIVMTLLGTGLRRAELIGLRLCDVEMVERQLRVRASTSKSVHAREIALYPETLKELDRYIRDFRAEGDANDALFVGRRGGPLTAQGIKRLFDRLKLRTGIRDLTAHMLRHTWATNFNRSGTGSAFDLQMEGGWTTPRMVQRYAKVRPLAERRRAPSPFTASRLALPNSGKRPAEMRPPQQRSVLSGRQTA